jgi:hypothetical protein
MATAPLRSGFAETSSSHRQARDWNQGLGDFGY